MKPTSQCALVNKTASASLLFEVSLKRLMIIYLPSLEQLVDFILKQYVYSLSISKRDRNPELQMYLLNCYSYCTESYAFKSIKGNWKYLISKKENCQRK